MLTTLAIVFVLVLLGSIFYGFSIIMRRPPTDEDLHFERCSLCRNKFLKEELVERAVGDYKVYYFCQHCITGLYDDVQGSDTPSGIDAKKLISDVHEKRN